MTTIITREEIGLRPPNLDRLTKRNEDELANRWGFTEHHTGFGGTLFHIDPLQRLRAIQAYHMDVLGYGDIAYGGAYDNDGNVFELRDGIFVQAHAGSNGNVANRYTDGICHLEDARGFTASACTSFGWWCDLYRFVMHGRTAKLVDHNWWSEGGRGGLPTECSGEVRPVVKFCGGLL